MVTPTENIDILDYFQKIRILIRKKSANLAALQQAPKIGCDLDRSGGRSAAGRPITASGKGVRRTTF